VAEFSLAARLKFASNDAVITGHRKRLSIATLMKPRKIVARSKFDLLPLPAADRDRISLECHLALCTLQAGQGDRHTLVGLTHALVAAYFLLEAGVEDGPESRDTFTAAQEAINQCDSGAIVDGRCAPATATSTAAIGGLLALYDRQLRRAPRSTVAQVVGQVDAYWRKSGGATSEGESRAARAGA